VTLAKRAAHIFANKATAVMTNVPGPRQPLYFSGVKVANQIFWVPRSGRLGMGISIFSYCGNVTVGLATDEGLVPDPEKMLDGFKDDFYYLLELVKSGKVFTKPLVINDRFLDTKTSDQTSDQVSGQLSGQISGQVSVQPSDQALDTSEPLKCAALTRAGKPCKNVAAADSDYCGVHQNYEQKAPKTRPSSYAVKNTLPSAGEDDMPDIPDVVIEKKRQARGASAYKD